MVFKGKENKAFHPFNILLFIINVISVSLFLFVLYRYFFEPAPKNQIIIFIRILTAYMCFILLKYGIEKIIANIFEFEDRMDYYLFQKLSHRNFISLFLLALTAIFIYTIPPTSFLLYSLIIIVLSTNLISLFTIYKQNQNLIAHNWFYFILYLCTLEIAPYIILYKLITI